MKNKKMKMIIKVILIVIAIFIVLVLINTFRNFMIVKEIQKNVSPYISSENYHIKSVATEETGVVTMNYYQKNGRQAMIMERDNNGEKMKTSMFNNGERIDVFYETAESKTAQLNADMTINVNIVNYVETENDWQTFMASMFAMIRKTDYNGKQCYIVDNFLSPTFMNSTGKNEVYIEKDTGLYVKLNQGEMVTEREYEFDNVQDEIFTEPDIGQYTVK